MYDHMNLKILYYVITVAKVTRYACAKSASHGGSALAVLRIASCALLWLCALVTASN